LAVITESFQIFNVSFAKVVGMLLLSGFIHRSFD